MTQGRLAVSVTSLPPILVADIDAIQLAPGLGVSAYPVKPVGYTALADVVRGRRRPWALLSGVPPA